MEEMSVKDKFQDKLLRVFAENVLLREEKDRLLAEIDGLKAVVDELKERLGEY